jgi:hypothetical protein
MKGTWTPLEPNFPPKSGSMAQKLTQHGSDPTLGGSKRIDTSCFVMLETRLGCLFS